MRHLMKGRRLNRSPSHLLAMKRNLACSIVAHEQCITTVAKAKEIRPFVEKLITLAKRGSAELRQVSSEADEAKKKTANAKALHVRRLLMQRLGGKRQVVIGDEQINVIDKLLLDIGPRFQDRTGGYTRIIKRTTRRLGDAAPTAMIELLAAGESKAPKAAPAPAVKS